MAYGVTSTTLLLAIGTNPAAASATVHFAEIGTSLMSGLSHWKFGNVDWKVVARIGLPGAIGAFAGATVLSSLSTEVAAPVMSLILLTLGAYILVRFTLRGIDRRNLGDPGQRPDGAAQGDRLDRHLRVPRRARRQPRLPVRPRLPGRELLLGPRPARRRAHRGADRRLAGATHPAAAARLAGRRHHRADQRPHPAEERLDRGRGQHPLRRLRRDLPDLGRRGRVVLPRVPQGPRAGVRRRPRRRGCAEGSCRAERGRRRRRDPGWTAQ